jgi:hypothetical protein
MKRPAAILAFLAALLVAAAACGDDGDGAAADVAGTWAGEYASERTDRAGTLCLELAQDGRDLTGALTFAGEEPVEVGGRIANERLSFAWSGGDGASPDGVVRLTSGGTFSGDAAGDTISGEWTALDADRGTWSVERAECGGETN